VRHATRLAVHRGACSPVQRGAVPRVCALVHRGGAAAAGASVAALRLVHRVAACGRLDVGVSRWQAGGGCGVSGVAPVWQSPAHADCVAVVHVVVPYVPGAPVAHAGVGRACGGLGREVR